MTRGLLWSVNKLDAEHLKPAKKTYMDGAEPKAEEPKADAPKTEGNKPAGPKADANGMVPLDLARGKVATASSNQGEGHLPGMAVDGDGETRWCADHGTFPQWWQVDLGKPQDLTGCLIAWEQPSAVYQYKVEGSADGKSWRMLADRTASRQGRPESGV